MAKALARLGYRPTRQVGSHVRFTTTVGGEHHVTVPAHDRIRVGTLAGILADVAAHHRLDRDQVLRRLFDPHP